MPESEAPKGVQWDLFLGPAPVRPFTLNRFHYGWHFFWDTATAEMGNNGVHALGQLRWAMGLNTHPIKIHSYGRVYPDGSDQETPHVQNASFEYADGTLMEIEVNTMPGPSFGSMYIYTPTGYVTASNPEAGAAGRGGAGAQPASGESPLGRGRAGAQPTSAQPSGERGGWSAIATELTPRPAQGPVGTYNAPIVSGVSERAFELSFPSSTTKAGPPIPDAGGRVSHFQNFIDCVRSRKVEDLYCDILEGHMSATLCHLANISYRTGRKLVFDPETERFKGDAEANRYLTREYRKPFVVPDKV